MSKKEIIALILAGGQGSRLKALTKDIAKPAVPFGGKYRIIDFPLSNCSNSGITTVGVLTQYKPLALNSHIGLGIPWDLDRITGGVTVLQPYMNQSGGNWYKGTANAIYHNISYIDSYDPEYVLILSGDHIYKMDYSKMFFYHKQKCADATIAVLDVPLNEASRFGIMNTNEDNSIYEFEEKPKAPKSTLASMGIYIFSWKKLKNYLIEDDCDITSNNDFGKNIIPKMISNKEKLFAYGFNGYWKDVGTIESYWEANMDLINKGNLNLYDKTWRIYSTNPTMPAQFIGPNAKVDNSLVVEGCVVLGEVKNSILFPGVFIDENTKVMNSVIMHNTKIGKNVIIDKAILGTNVIVNNNTVVGNSKDIIVIENDKIITSNYITE